MLQPINLHSEKTELKISKPYLQFFLQNSLPEQAKVAEEGVDSMERAAQVRMQPVWWDNLE